MAEAQITQDAPPSVEAVVNYSVDTGETPVAIVAEMGAGPDKRSAKFESYTITIHNGRLNPDAYGLETHGFEIMDYPTEVKDFFDEEEVRRVYYPEMERLVRQETGASRVLVFDHTIRVGDENLMKTRKLRTPVHNMHNDFTRRSAPQRVRDLLPADEAEARLKGRYGSINVWRPLEPVETEPLAICEYGSISDDDLIAAERRYPDGRIGGVYHLKYSPKHRWTWFPHMGPEEVVLLKCFDSREDTARWTAHGAFNDPTAPPNPAPRQSIEIRTLYFYD